MPSPVAENMIAISNGERTRPTVCSPTPITSPDGDRKRKADTGELQQPAAEPLVIDLEAGDEEQEREADQRHRISPAMPSHLSDGELIPTVGRRSLRRWRCAAHERRLTQ
jgi:hypothetical protein